MQAPRLRPFGPTPDDAERGNKRPRLAARSEDFGARVTFAVKING
jgi:hypothetical protein